MKYSLDWIKEKDYTSLKYLFFWGHTVPKDGSVNQSCLSQWFVRPFEHEGITYRTAEHWMMAEKARLFKDAVILEKILKCETPGEAKKLGRKVRGFNAEVWDNQGYKSVCNGNYLKFSQHEDLKFFLLNSKNRILVEASPVDYIWGIGLSKDAKGVENPENWRGKNLLGFALMEVRDLLVDA